MVVKMIDAADQLNNGRRAFQLLELVITLGILLILVLLLLPAGTGNKASGTRIQCVNNLRTVGDAFHTWSGEHGGEFPARRGKNYSGTLQYVEGPEVFRHFQVMSNELPSTEVLVCPADVRKRALDFRAVLANEHVSYFVDVDATPSSPSMFLTGDRNLTNGLEVMDHLLLLDTNHGAGWTHRIHVRQGNIGLADGSVQQFSNTRLREGLGWSAVRNRLALP
jgi:competence protein ComGC